MDRGWRAPGWLCALMWRGNSTRGMTKTRAILLSAAGLLPILLVPVLPQLRPVLAGAQAATQTPAAAPAKPAPKRMDSHTALGLGRVPDAEAARRGEPIFVQNCQACHGEGARGGIGPNLVRSVLVLHDDSGEALTQVIHSGRPQSGMPPFPQITDAQAHDLSEYLHQMIELAANRGLYTNASTMASGNADRGKAFFAAHCASCHSATGDLAKVATKYSDPPTLIDRKSVV